MKKSPSTEKDDAAKIYICLWCCPIDHWHFAVRRLATRYMYPYTTVYSARSIEHTKKDGRNGAKRREENIHTHTRTLAQQSRQIVRSFNSMVLYPIHISIRKLIKLLWNCLYLDFDKPTDACLFSSHTHTRIIANSNTLHEIFMENYVFCLKYVYGFGFVLFSIPEYHIP